MKEKVQKLKSAGIVDFENFYIGKHKNNYSVSTSSRFFGKEHCISIDDVEKMANQLLRFVEEIRGQEKFSYGDDYFYVRPFGDYEICESTYVTKQQDYFCMQIGNIFKTRKEAEQHRDEIIAKFEEARKKYVSN